MAIDLVAFKASLLAAAEPKGDGVLTCRWCGRVPEFYSPEGREEFCISGSCEFCFDDLFTDLEERCATCEKPLSWHTYKRAGACPQFVDKLEGEHGEAEDETV